MNRRQQYSNWIITLTIIAALLLTILPLPTWAGWLRPLWLLMVLCYWAMALEDRASVGLAWLLGIVLDLLQGTLFAEHALAMCCCIYIITKLRRKIRLFSFWQQAITIGLVSTFYQVVIYYIQKVIGQPPQTMLFWLPIITTAGLWPWLFVLLRDTRRRFKVV
jgi:rod shape-determining protein MreD